MRAEERSALTRVYLSALLLLVSAVVSILIAFGTGLGVGAAATTGSGVGLRVTSGFLALTFTSVGLEFVVVLLLWSAYRKLAALDPRFSTPAKMTLLLAIAVVIVGAALYPLLVQVNSTFGCLENNMGNTTAASGCLSGTFAALILVLVLAAILALVGFIGMLLGLWRVGTRYQSSTIKAGTILLIFPVLNFVGAILILVGAHSARGSLDRGTPTQAYRP